MTRRHDPQAYAETTAEQVVNLARLNADAVVVVARDKADHDSKPSSAIENRPSSVTPGRKRTKSCWASGRADDRLRREREDGGHALADLLALERERTDRDLLTERARSDEEIANRDDFLAIVSHDLRNLLGGIVLSSSLSPSGPRKPMRESESS